MKTKLSAGLEYLKGKIGNACGQQRKSGTALVKKSYPYAVSGEQRSPAQQAQNTAYGEAVQTWHELTFMERAGYDLLAEIENISGFNYFMRETLGVSRYDSAKYDSAKYG